MSDPMDYLKKNSFADLASESKEQLYFVRVRVPAMKKTLALVVEVSQERLNKPEVQELLKEEGQTIEHAEKHVAAALVMLQLTRAGVAKEDAEAAEFFEIRKTTVEETNMLAEKFAYREGN